MEPAGPVRSGSSDSWYRRFGDGVRSVWAWAQRRHLPALLSVVLLALLLVAERKLLKVVLRAQDGLKGALGDLKHTVDDELGEARSALHDTRTLESDIRSRLDALHGRELSDVPVLAKALKDELDAGVGRARGVVSALGTTEAPQNATPRVPAKQSVQEELATLASQLAEAQRLALELSERARKADEALGPGSDGGVAGFPDVRAQAAHIAQRLSQAELVMFSRASPSPELGSGASAKDASPHAPPPDNESFPALYARARELSVALDRSYARMLGDGGVQDASDLGGKLREIQLRLLAFQARLDRVNAALRVEENALQRKVGTADAGAPETKASTNNPSEQP